jgi:hypothetical protein
VRKIGLVVLVFVLSVGFVLPISAQTGTAAVPPSPVWQDALEASLDWMTDTAPKGPQIGGGVGEWAVITLARAGRIQADDEWLKPWLAELAGDTSAVIRRWTDYQRVALALDALGLDNRDFITPYRVFLPFASRTAMNRTVLADIYAIRALDAVGLDSHWYRAHLFHLQRGDGTWSLTPTRPTSVFDIDITAMAVQALAPYYVRGDIRTVRAVTRAVEWLLAQTYTDAESTAQALIALTMLGYTEEAEDFAQKLMQWYDPVLGGFIRPAVPNRVNAMATVQAAYALTYLLK